MSHNIIIPTDMHPRPKPHEESAAVILSKYFDCDVRFIVPTDRNTPDILMRNIDWEMKSPIGNGKNNIQKNMREASRQSSNIVIDLRRPKLHQSRAIGYVREYLSHPNKIK